MISEVLTATQFVLGAMLAGFGGYQILAVRAALRWRRDRVPAAPDFTPPVTLLKPLRGADVGAFENFASFCRQNYPADRIQIVFGAASPDDPALVAARRLQAEFPQIDIIIETHTERTHGLNRKVCNLAAMAGHAGSDLLVLCDSDIRVGPDYLRRITAPFAPANNEGAQPVGVVTCPYRGERILSLPAILESLGMGADFIPSALVSRDLEGAGFAFGSTIVIPREVLEKTGGFERLTDELADDYRLGEGAKACGYRVVVSDYMVQNVLGREPFSAMWRRRLRWARTVRACRPVGYAGSVVTYGVPLALLFAAASGFSAIGGAVLAVVIALRASGALLIARQTGDGNVKRYLHFLPLSDLFSFVLFIASYCGSEIHWRGETFRLQRGGGLAPLTRSRREGAAADPIGGGARSSL